MPSDGDSGSDMSTDSDEFEGFDPTPDHLIQAARYGILEEVEALVNDYGVDINGLDSESYWTALAIASFNGHVDVVKFLVENGAEMNRKEGSIGFRQWSAIHFASSHGHCDVVEVLLGYGATVDDREHEGRAAIHLASENGHEELVKFLLARGASVHDRDQNGFTPLFTACLHGHHGLVLTLLANGARIDDRAESKATPLSAACSGGCVNIIETLLAQGADVNDYEFPRFSPLYCASRRGHDDVVKTLLAHGAQVRGREFSVYNPLHPACAGGHYKVVMTLLNEGADVDSHDEKGMTLLQNACNGMFRAQFIPELQISDKAYTLRILLEHGVDPGVPDKEGLSTFERVTKDEWALYSFDKDLLTLLLDYGVGTGIKCRVGKCGCNSTALMCWYMFFRLLFTVSPEAHASVGPLIDTYEKYFIKTRTAGVYSCDMEKAIDPPDYLDWNQQKRDGFQGDCAAELAKLKIDTIGDTSATYFCLLTRDVAALRHRNLLGQLSSEYCLQQYPIYGNMVVSSYTRLRRFFLEEVSPGFFAISSPPLLPECAEVVQRYLTVRDLESLVEVYRAYQTYLEKMSKLFKSPEQPH